jgi:hypothetical protein
MTLNEKVIARITLKERAHAARLEGNTNENFATTAVEIIPLILSGRVIKVWGELDTAEEDVIAHVVVRASFWLLLSQVDCNDISELRDTSLNDQ